MNVPVVGILPSAFRFFPKGFVAFLGKANT
nr:MAG TPA: hypothetical protein [Caudoviricetes sp.]